MIAEGALDKQDGGIDVLAGRLGIGARHLRRLFKQHVGTTPVAIAQTRRVLFAKQLIHETSLSMTEVALASGFGSVRRFNETFHKLFQRPPGALRRKSSQALSVDSTVTGVTLRLRYRPPYDWCSMLAFLKARAIGGVESSADECYRRTVSHGGQTGSVEVVHLAAHNSLAVTVHFPCVRALPAIVGRVRGVFDVGADVEKIGAHLSHDSQLAPLIAQRPGLRLPAGGTVLKLQFGRYSGNRFHSELAASSPLSLSRCVVSPSRWKGGFTRL